MFVLQVSLHSLGAEHSVINRKFLPWFKADDFVVLYLQLNPALHSAKAAMRFDQLRIAGLLVFQPAARRLVV